MQVQKKQQCYRNLNENIECLKVKQNKVKQVEGLTYGTRHGLGHSLGATLPALFLVLQLINGAVQIAWNRGILGKTFK